LQIIETMGNLKITSKKIGSGTFEISVWDSEKGQEKGKFETHDAQLHDAINDFEDQDWFDTEQNLIDYCLEQI